MSDATGTTTKTLHALSTRLSRLEFVLTGSPSPPSPAIGSEQPIRVRIRALHTDLQRLQAKSRTVAEILQLHAKFPEAFSPPTATMRTGREPDVHAKTATVLAAAPEFAAAASQLSAIGDTPIPAPAESARLVALLPRLQRAEEVQRRQEARIAELRRRSVDALEGWYRLGVMGVNDCFAEWDERTARVERAVVRKRAELED